MSPLNSAAEPITKAEFARRRSVTAARVTQWISEGRIDGAALVGTGRHALIDEDLAIAQLDARLDAVQRKAHYAPGKFARPIAIDRHTIREVEQLISSVVVSALPDLAAIVAGDFNMPVRDVLARLQRGWRSLCERAP